MVVRCQLNGFTINLKYGWIINQLIRSGPIHWYTNLSWYHVRLLNKFQSFILIRKPPFLIPRLFVLFNKFLFVCPLFCSILFSMKGKESDFPTYLLHCYILCTSATKRWDSQIHCPSYQIKSSKVDDVRCNGILLFL